MMCCDQLRPARGIGRLGTDWGQWLQQQMASWSQTGQQILQAENIPRGVYTTTGPAGTTTIVQPTGVPISQTGATVQASPGVGLILVGGAALLLVMLMARK